MLSQILNATSIVALSGLLLTSSLVTPSWGMDVPEEEPKIHGMLLRATLPNGKTLHFVPSYHSTPLSAFSEDFKREVLSHQTPVFETVDKEETEPGFLLRCSSKEYLQQHKGFVESEEQKWSFNLPSDVAQEIEGQFQAFRTALSEHIDLSHFSDIYKLKPGVVLGLYTVIKATMREDLYCGMDDDIEDHYFTHQGTKALSVETMEDFIESLPIFEARYEDIKDDFEDMDNDLIERSSYTSSLLQLHEDFLQEKKSNKKSLLTESSLKTRNEKWVPKLMAYSTQYDDLLCTFGQLHFVGEGGLISLGQNQGWTWSLFKENGEYQPFHYNATAELPISDRIVLTGHK